MKNMFENDDDVVNLKATELKLGLPGRDDESEQQSSSSGKSNKRSTPEMDNSGQKDAPHRELHGGAPPPSKGQVVGWPPVRAYRKNALQQQNQKKTNVSSETATGMYVKVSMDGAPYLRKIDLKLYKSYLDLVKALESMFNCTIGKQGSDEYAPTYEDKDGDWMLVGDVPWEMFASSCKRMRIMKGSEAQGLA